MLAVVCSQRDDELRYASEPFMHLLLHSGLLPSAGAEHYLLTLTENNATAFIKGIRRPHKRDVSRVEMEVVLVMKISVFHQDIASHPSINLICRDDRDVWSEVFWVRKA